MITYVVRVDFRSLACLSSLESLLLRYDAGIRRMKQGLCECRHGGTASRGRGCLATRHSR